MFCSKVLVLGSPPAISGSVLVRLEPSSATSLNSKSSQFEQAHSEFSFRQRARLLRIVLKSKIINALPPPLFSGGRVLCFSIITKSIMSHSAIIS